jgi:hypothetical protein
MACRRLGESNDPSHPQKDEFIFVIYFIIYLLWIYLYRSGVASVWWAFNVKRLDGKINHPKFILIIYIILLRTLLLIFTTYVKIHIPNDILNSSTTYVLLLLKLFWACGRLPQLRNEACVERLLYLWCCRRHRHAIRCFDGVTELQTYSQRHSILMMLSTIAELQSCRLTRDDILYLWCCRRHRHATRVD